jgi:isoleucyl-tRNA synthetase
LEELEKQLLFPADFISEAIDQTRGWFYTLLAVSTLLEKGISYRNVICLGHVLDEKGQKMSKSKGNVVSPWEVGEKYGFDAVRWYFYTVNQPGDAKRFREQDLRDIVKRLHLILWNVYSFFVTYANAAGWIPTEGYRVQGSGDRNILDAWIDSRLQEVVNTVSDSLEAYDIFRAARTLDNFVQDLSTWYVRRSRERFQIEKDPEAFATLYFVLLELSKLLAPFTPFLTENIYRGLRGSEESVHLETWPERKEQTSDQTKVLADMELVREQVAAGHALRKELGVPVRASMLSFDTTDEQLAQNPELLEIIRAELNIEKHDNSLLNSTSSSVKQAGKLFIDTTVDKQKALARELTRHVQQLRKDSGLKVGEFVELFYDGDEKLAEALDLFDRKRTFVQEMRKGREKVDTEREVELDGNRIWFGLRRVSS